MRDLRSRRANAGMTIEQLADASGVTSRTISKIERGLSSGSPLTRAKLERALSGDPCRQLYEAAREARDELEQYQAEWMETLAQKLGAAIQSYEAQL